MTFNPNDYLINLRGQKYLEVKWRIAWFRHDNPQGEINTEVVSIEPLIVRAMVAIEGRVVGSGLASADAGSKKVVWSGREVEKAETAAIGRALAVAGYGTQFTGDDFSDSDHLADSPAPIQRTSPQPEARRVPPAQDNTRRDVLLVEGVKEVRQGQKGEIQKYKFKVDGQKSDDYTVSCFCWQFAEWSGLKSLKDASAYDETTGIYTPIHPIKAEIEQSGNFWNVVAVERLSS